MLMPRRKSRRLLSVGGPDVFDLGCAAEERAVLRFGPVGGRGRGPGGLEVAGGKGLDLGGAGRVADIPERVDSVVFGERLGEDIRGIEDIEEMAGLGEGA